MGITTILGDFANWSTVSGVPHVANAQTKISRIFWSVVFVCMICVFCYQLYTMLVKFFSFPASVNTEIFFEQQRYPVVTVCNFNPYKYDKVDNNGKLSGIKQLMNEYSAAVNGNLTSAADTYGLFDVMSQSYDRDSRARDALVLEAAKLTEADLEPALYQFEDLISECSFSGNTCGSSDFTRFVDPVYGACYSFNEDTALNYSSNRAGMKFGLKLLITVSQEDPEKETSDFLPTTVLAGARIGINGPGAQPALDSSGINVGVGFQTAVSLTMTRTTREKRPYGTCVDSEDEDTNYYPDKTYTMETCFNGCRQREAMRRCGCTNPRYRKKDGEAYCLPIKQNLDCLQRLKGDQANPSQPNLDPLTDCGCDPPCEETTFLTTASLASYPSELYMVATEPGSTAPSCDGNQTSLFSNELDDWTTDDGKIGKQLSINRCKKWYNNNALLLQVFFETLKFEKYTEYPSYGMSAILNDLGGQAGLWLGLSVISIIEVCGLLILLCTYCVSGGAMKVRPSDIEDDHRIKDIEDVKNELDKHEKDNSVRKRMKSEEEDKDD